MKRVVHAYLRSVGRKLNGKPSTQAERATLRRLAMRWQRGRA